MEFKPAHLQSRFLAEQPEYQDLRVELELASRFGDIEDHICDEASQNGRFHRQRSFLENASRASFDAWRLMMDASGKAYMLHDRLRDHGKETRTWREQFRRRCNGRLQAMINRTAGALRTDIPGFADCHCENDHIGQLWRLKVEGANVDEQMQELQRDLHGEAVDKIGTLGEELAKELELLSAEFEAPNLKGGRIANHRRIWDWGTRGLAGALNLASWAVRATPFLPLAPFLKGASMAVGLVGPAFRGKFGDKDQRRREAIGNNTLALNRSLDQLETSAREIFTRWMEEKPCGTGGGPRNRAIGRAGRQSQGGRRLLPGPGQGAQPTAAPVEPGVPEHRHAESRRIGGHTGPNDCRPGPRPTHGYRGPG